MGMLLIVDVVVSAAAEAEVMSTSLRPHTDGFDRTRLRLNQVNNITEIRVIRTEIMVVFTLWSSLEVCPHIAEV